MSHDEELPLSAIQVVGEHVVGVPVTVEDVGEEEAIEEGDAIDVTPSESDGRTWLMKMKGTMKTKRFKVIFGIFGFLAWTTGVFFTTKAVLANNDDFFVKTSHHKLALKDSGLSELGALEVYNKYLARPWSKSPNDALLETLNDLYHKRSPRMVTENLKEGKFPVSINSRFDDGTSLFQRLLSLRCSYCSSDYSIKYSSLDNVKELIDSGADLINVGRFKNPKWPTLLEKAKSKHHQGAIRAIQSHFNSAGFFDKDQVRDAIEAFDLSKLLEKSLSSHIPTSGTSSFRIAREVAQDAAHSLNTRFEEFFSSKERLSRQNKNYPY